jgi:hypothetical protein
MYVIGVIKERLTEILGTDGKKIVQQSEFLPHVTLIKQREKTEMDPAFYQAEWKE